MPTKEPFDENENEVLDADDLFVRDLFANLGGEFPEPSDTLPEQTMRKIQADLTSRDLLDLTTFVFLIQFCAPLLDLLASMFGHDSLASSQQDEHRELTDLADPNPTPNIPRSELDE